MHRLPGHVAAAVYASGRVTSVAALVQELALNALQAEATEVVVRVTCAQGSVSVTVTDDGHGISVQNLQRLGESNMTSRHNSGSSGSFGSRGTALFALARSCAGLCITTCTGGAVYQRELSAADSDDGNGMTAASTVAVCHDARHQRRGTRILVSGVFARIPVRQRLLLEAGEAKMIRDVRSMMLQLAMMKHQVSFILYEKADHMVLRSRPALTLRDAFLALHPELSCVPSGCVRDIEYTSSSCPSTWRLDAVVAGPIWRIDTSRRRAVRQYVFLNGRAVQRTRNNRVCPLFQLPDSVLTEFQPVPPATAPPNATMACHFVFHLCCPESLYELQGDVSHGEQLLEFHDWSVPLAFLGQALVKMFPPADAFIAKRPFTTPSPTKRVFLRQSSPPADAASIDVDGDAGDPFQQEVAKPSSTALFPTTCLRLATPGAVAVRRPAPQSPSAVARTRPKIAMGGSRGPRNSLVSQVRSQPPLAIDKLVVGQFRVLCQVESKFILAAHQGKLFVVDQHAAHERVRLDHLENQLCLGPDGLPRRSSILVSVLCDALPLPLSADHLACLQRHDALLCSWGWRWRISVSRSGSNVAMVTAMPQVCGVASDPAALRAFLQLLQQLSGVQGVIPPFVRDVLASKACRGAVMFGDPLSVSQCQALVRDLARCRLPFQCAHGRPTVTPLFDTKHARSAASRHASKPPRRHLRHALRPYL